MATRNLLFLQFHVISLHAHPCGDVSNKMSHFSCQSDMTSKILALVTNIDFDLKSSILCLNFLLGSIIWRLV